tara:strand:- start:1696 stop:2328 length:633 start_codon:yes stop_codon:yes gene_type:complete
LEPKKGNFNFPIIIIIFAVAIGILYLFNAPTPVGLNVEEEIVQEIEEKNQVIEAEEIEEIVVNPDIPVIEPELPGIVEEIIQEEIANNLSEDCLFGKELRNTPENPMTYTCQLITLEGEVELSMRNKRFEQTEIQVKKGTTVTWINKDNSDPEYMPIHTVAIDLLNVKSPDLEVGGGARAVWSYTFNEIGEFEYYCSVHPVMTGKIIVVE